MKKILIFVICSCMAFISFGQQPEAIKTIVIDPGHGGKDNGTSGSNSVEKDLTLEVALQLKKEINSQFPNIKVILTREQDEFISLHKRSNIANLSNADLFISLHCNHIDESYVNGSEIYILGLSKADENLQIVKRENAIWDDQDNNENENEESHILFSLYQNATLSSSADFGQLLEKNLAITTTLKQRGVKQAGFSVLKNATMPSVLVEIAYLSNSSDEQYILSNKGKTEVCKAITKAVQEYINPYDINAIESDKTTYCIFLCEAESPVLNSQKYALHLLDNFEVSEKHNRYQFHTGSFISFQEAEKDLMFFKKNGFEDAKIIEKQSITSNLTLIQSKKYN